MAAVQDVEIVITSKVKTPAQIADLVISEVFKLSPRRTFMHRIRFRIASALHRLAHLISP